MGAGKVRKNTYRIRFALRPLPEFQAYAREEVSRETDARHSSSRRHLVALDKSAELHKRTVMRTDEELRKNVEDELRWAPDLDADNIAVNVKDGIVTLAGFVHSYVDKFIAEKVVKRVAGVAAIANDIEVRLPTIDERPDPEIARDAVAAIKSQLPALADQIKVIVKDGEIALEGSVPWHYQKDAAELAVRRIRGVKNVHNVIQLAPVADPDELK